MTENWRHQSLSDSFKALNKKTDALYTCKRDSEGTYSVSWPYGTEGKVYCVTYGESTLKEIIYRDKQWSIMEYAKKELPDKFKFTCPNDSTVFTATLESELYEVTWPVGGENFSTTYCAHTVEDHISGCLWKIVEETPEQCHGKQIVSLQDIQEFCKECSAEITFAYIHGEPHYDVFYSGSEIAQAESDEGLVEIMKAIRVLYGSK